jgi:hypothetical protein
MPLAPLADPVHLSSMSQPSSPKTVSLLSLAVDAVAVLGFFVVIFTLVRPHVQSVDPRMVILWSGLTAACLSGVFWLALQMFRVVLAAQRARPRH